MLKCIPAVFGFLQANECLLVAWADFIDVAEACLGVVE